jgi:A/G-specific adenine glycosylase
MEVRRLRAPLLRWYRKHRRDLPWRRTDDPYAVWVAEIMLQQTRVATVIPYYKRFMDRFPDAASLARASEDEVLSLWSGLGYYRRARALRAGARMVTEAHGGRLPDDPRTLAELPGIGRYTAGAIASVAFGRAEPVLDGNVRRVLSRVLAIDGERLGRGEEQRLLWQSSGALVQGPRPGDLNQALMELGALICTTKRPTCELCPLARHCRAHRSGDPEAYPCAEPKKPTTRVRVAVALVRRGRNVLLERTPGESPLRGRWDVPAREIEPRVSAGRAIHGRLAESHGIDIAVYERLGAVAHGIMDRRLGIEVYRCSLRRGRVAASVDLRWISPARLSEIPVSGATRKVLRLTGEIG